MQTLIEHQTLPKRFQDEGLSVLFSPAADLGISYVEQLVGKSRQSHIQEFEGPEDIGTVQVPGRFRSIEDYQRWAASKERFMFLLINEHRLVGPGATPELGGISWFGSREHQHAPGRTVTFAMRNYAADVQHNWGQYSGRGLAAPFMQIAHQSARNIFAGEKLWLDLVAGNEASRKMCINAGYRELIRFDDDDHNGQTRVVMVNDTALLEG
ncbi:MAG: hypothetical protein ABI354_02410 [Candidatus Saccharimonadales bacterium]